MKIRHIIIKQDEQEVEWKCIEAPSGLQIQKMQFTVGKAPEEVIGLARILMEYTSVLSSLIPKNC